MADVQVQASWRENERPGTGMGTNITSRDQTSLQDGSQCAWPAGLWPWRLARPPWFI
jgi:hypothetical protein